MVEQAIQLCACVQLYTVWGNNSANKEFQFWQHEFHPILLDTFEKQPQILLYLHQNPVRAGIVWLPQDYEYSSAIDYYTDLKDGLLNVALLS